MGNSLKETFEGKIDFVGQKTVDDISRIALIVITVVSFIVGFALQSLSVTFAIFGGSSLVLILLLLPPWPMFNQHPVKWLPVIETKKGQ
ncbi:microsomal signal peptidase [Athelia psychrophila]|uniref:Signal peptidase complex subunit 1 n=1 Tax=Athelia psychrophila TaxID=1759441 RepID=A0A166LGN4_9AGAM|nr:microsomal signal peptidase [Fibularhizoctonia sp. CBS 109695]